MGIRSGQGWCFINISIQQKFHGTLYKYIPTTQLDMNNNEEPIPMRCNNVHEDRVDHSKTFMLWKPNFNIHKIYEIPAPNLLIFQEKSSAQ